MMITEAAPIHILRADQFDRAFLDHLCLLTDTIRRFDKSKDGLMYLKSLLPHRRAMLYFTQPSTRTFLSFQSACQILGIQPNEIRDSATSSELKGESIEDSLRTFSSYVDLIIMRTAVPGLCDRIAAILDRTDRPVPIINAGSGPDQHPTQALLDIYTLNRSFRTKGGIEGKTVMMAGDILRGRTVRSLSLLLTNYRDVRLVFSSPKPFMMKDDLRQVLKQRGVSFIETEEFETHLPEVDAIYMTRIQDEYDSTPGESANIDYSKYHLKYEHLKRLRPEAVIMHPLPRRKELDPAIDHDPRAKYWRQERNGMWTRVALITKVMGVDQHIVLPEL
jgi:aspartate carbamoyltransferase catalytic subunit